MFKCLSIADRQHRVFDVVENSQFTDLALKMNKINFKYIQKSQVHVLANDLLVIVSENDGESLSRFAMKLTTSIDEHLLRQMIKDLLEAVLYLNENFGIDFKFTPEDVITNSDKAKENKFSFRLRNTFIQKARVNFLRLNANSNQNFSQVSEGRKQIGESTCKPVLAIRSLGKLATDIAKNRFGFSNCQLDFGCSWASESLREVITSMAHYASTSSCDPKSFLSKFMTGIELKFERMKSVSLNQSGGHFRRRSLGLPSKSSPF